MFVKQPIKFRTTTARAVGKLTRQERLDKLAGLCADNAQALWGAIEYCRDHDIGCFRVNSQILPLKTHPQLGYKVTELPGGREITDQFKRCGELARRHGLRTTFHPDQFVVLNSPDSRVVRSSVAEIEYQTEVAQWIGADVTNIHGGGAYGDKCTALQRFAQNLKQLSAEARKRLTVENDDKVYTPSDLLPLCEATGLPLVYDAHHHRCKPDGSTIAETTERALGTWDREPLFHISSPLQGWSGPKPNRHHDYIHLRDFPVEWDSMNITVEVEAKAKELAVKRLHH
jgi:UV DNA damage endonuclease